MIVALQMFKTGVKPEWEDKTNKAGFRIDLSGFRDSETLQNLWERLVFDLITGNNPQTEKGISGIRLVQKNKGNVLNYFRVELWVTDGNEKSEQNQEVHKYLTEKILGEVMENTQCGNAIINWIQK